MHMPFLEKPTRNGVQPRKGDKDREHTGNHARDVIGRNGVYNVENRRMKRVTST